MMILQDVNAKDFIMLSKVDLTFKELQNKQMQVEYTSRQKALMDYNTIMEERLQEGIAIGEKKDMEKIIAKLKKAGISDENIQDILK